MMPHQRNPQFVGRLEFLTTLRQRLCDTKPKRFNHRIAIYGIGGVGKTQCAIEYIYRYKNEYDGIFWVSAVDQAVLLSGFLNIAIATECVKPAMELAPRVLAKRVLSWLNQQDKWLLVVDNLEDASVLNGYLPETAPRSHVLITTRNPNVADIPAEGARLDILQETEAIALLCVRAKLDLTDYPLERREAALIVAELGFLALAIDQAAAFIRVVLKDISKFLPTYRQSRRVILRRETSGAADYPNSVAKTFLLSFEKVKESRNGKTAAKLLQLLSFLNPDGTLLEFLEDGKNGLDQELHDVIQDSISFDEALTTLETFSLIRRSGNGKLLLIHRLTQAVVKDEMPDEVFRGLSCAVIGLCDAAFPPESKWETRPSCRRYEAQVVGPLLETVVLQSPMAVDVLLRVGKYLRDDGKIKESERVFLEALRLCRASWGEEHINTLAAKNHLALTYEDLGRTAQAAQLYEEVYSTRRNTLGPEHPDTLAALGNVSSIYLAQGKLKAAAVLQENVLNARKRILGPEHPDTLKSMGIVALTYGSLGRIEEAAKLLETQLEVNTRLVGENHPATLTTAGNVALIYGAMGRTIDALEMQEKVLKLNQQLHGEDAQAVLVIRFEISLTYHALGRTDEALELREKVLSGTQRLVGDEHPATLTVMNAIALSYWALGRKEEAEKLQETVVASRRNILGNHHPVTLISLLLLSTMYHEEGRITEAEKLEKEVEGANHFLDSDIQRDVFSVTQMDDPALLYKQHIIFVQNSVGSRRR